MPNLALNRLPKEKESCHGLTQFDIFWVFFTLIRVLYKCCAALRNLQLTLKHKNNV